MEKLNQIYKCAVCGNVVEVVHPSGGQLVCCGQPMEPQEEKTTDPELGEKHLPVIERDDDFAKIKIGSIPHPMIETHYIEWIEVIAPDTGDVLVRKYLKPGDAPEMIIQEKDCPGLIQALDKMILREYCNIHLLWAKK
ncbi:MAG: desulfoferrodoxin [Candidatus Paceibacterota bacterium]